MNYLWKRRGARVELATDHELLGVLSVPTHQHAGQPADRPTDDGVLVLVPLVGQPAALKSLETSQNTG